LSRSVTFYLNGVREELHIFIDQFQASLTTLSDTIDNTWFLTDQA
jgi:hypothetical protein